MDLVSRACAILAREAARWPSLASVPRAVPTPELDAAGSPPLLRDAGTSDPVDRFPLIRSVAPVKAGEVGHATLRVANEDTAATEVTLYCTNLASDSGYDIPAFRVTCSPRRAVIEAKSEAAFDLAVTVPQQAPAGTYSGLVQATGTQYVKAVLSVEVL